MAAGMTVAGEILVGAVAAEVQGAIAVVAVRVASEEAGRAAGAIAAEVVGAAVVALARHLDRVGCWVAEVVAALAPATATAATGAALEARAAVVSRATVVMVVVREEAERAAEGMALEDWGKEAEEAAVAS